MPAMSALAMRSWPSGRVMNASSSAFIRETISTVTAGTRE